MKSLENKLIIYDSNCKVCSSLRDVVLKFTSIPESKVKAFAELDENLVEKVDRLKFKNVMALIDLTGKETIYGEEGVSYILSSQYKWVDVVLSFKPIFNLFSFLYKTQAYNRYIIALPKSNYECDCFPDKVIKYRLSFILICISISLVLTSLLGISLSGFFAGMTPCKASVEMLLMAGTGWGLQIVGVALFMKNKKLDYLGHLGSNMVVGLLVLVPWIILQSIFNLSSVIIPALNILLSSGIMLWLHYERVRYLKLNQVWT